MTQKYRTHTQLIVVLIILSLCYIFPLATAEQNLPKDPKNPNNNYTIYSSDTPIAYTQPFLKNHPNDVSPTIEFGGLYYLNDKLNLTADGTYLNPLFRYIANNGDYLTENPNSKVIIKMHDCEPIEAATSYTNRDKYSIYPGDFFISTNTYRGPNDPKPNNEINVYMHTDNLQKYSYQIHHNELNWFGIYNPKYKNFIINPIFGINKINSYTTHFIHSQHYKEKITQIGEYSYYKKQPNLETTLDYIFTQSPQLLNNPYSKIYLNLKGHHWFYLNRETIAYSKYLEKNETQKPYTLSINEIIQKKNKLPQQLLITKTPGTDNQVGVFIDLETLNYLEPEISDHNFKWISTYNYNRDDSYWFTPSNGWVDTIYEPLPGISQR